MTDSVINITCDKCQTKFIGVLHDLLNVSKEYAATCPNCSNQTFIKDRAAIINTAIPDDAVEIMYVTPPVNQ